MTLPIIKISTSIPEVKEYRLKYYFGTWITKSIICAESDAEAIHDADEYYSESCLNGWKYPVALFCGNRKVKDYNNNNIYGTK